MENFDIDKKEFREQLIKSLNEAGIDVDQTPSVDCECYILCRDAMLTHTTIIEVLRYIPIQAFIWDLLENVIRELVDEIKKRYTKICIFLPRIVQYDDDISKKIIFKIMIQDLNNIQ